MYELDDTISVVEFCDIEKAFRNRIRRLSYKTTYIYGKSRTSSGARKNKIAGCAAECAFEALMERLEIPYMAYDKATALYSSKYAFRSVSTPADGFLYVSEDALETGMKAEAARIERYLRSGAYHFLAEEVFDMSSAGCFTVEIKSAKAGIPEGVFKGKDVYKRHMRSIIRRDDFFCPLSYAKEGRDITSNEKDLIDAHKLYVDKFHGGDEVRFRADEKSRMPGVIVKVYLDEIDFGGERRYCSIIPG